MAMGGVLLRRIALVTRRLSPPAPLAAATAAAAAVAAAARKPFCSYVVKTIPEEGHVPNHYLDEPEEGLVPNHYLDESDEELVPNHYLDETFEPGGGAVLNRYIGKSFTPCDLQQLIERQSKGDAQVLPVITEEIVFRRLVRMCKRSIAATNNSMGYCLALGSDSAHKIPPRKVENENLLDPQLRRIIHYHRFIEEQSTKEAATEAGEDATKWKDIFREVRPRCYDLLSRYIKRTLVYVSVELGDMCERGEIKGEDAYDLLKHIAKDMDENREKDWIRYLTSYII